MNISKRHHFIPVFYLEHFTDADGFFHIYDIKKELFKNNRRKFAPSTHFYEHYGNTTFLGDEVSDFIELSYTKYDTRIADTYKK